MDIRIGTRGSQLARWQADWVAEQLRQRGHSCQIVLLTTQGDVRSEALRDVGGQGLFTKEIQRALLDREVDLAVHSLKDLPTDPVDGLALAAVPERVACGDVLICRTATGLDTLPRGARVATGSIRRQAQLLAYRPDLKMGEIRGNVDTRLKKLHQESWDALVLAEAGLRRLGLQDQVTQVLPTEVMLPAVGQGALGLETRVDDDFTRDAVAALDHRPSHQAVIAERSLLHTLQAGCLAPVGAWGRCTEPPDENRADALSPARTSANPALLLEGIVLHPAGTSHVRMHLKGNLDDGVELGRLLAAQLVAAGADRLLAIART